MTTEPVLPPAIQRYEIEFPADYAEREARPWGVLFHCRENPISYDSNHAVVLDLDGDLDAAIREIVAFYRERDLTPRIYSGGLQGEMERLRPRLEAAAFTFEVRQLRWFVLEGESRLRPNPAMQVRRVAAVDDALVQLLNSDGDAPWSVGVVQRHLAHPDYHLLVGYVSGRPVTMASLKHRDGFGRVDDVLTDPAHRGQGYARTVMDHLVRLHRDLCPGLLYLWADNPVAIRAYLDAGFVERGPVPPTWSAWLPQGAKLPNG